jgi:putative transcriptional regulator
MQMSSHAGGSLDASCWKVIQGGLPRRSLAAKSLRCNVAKKLTGRARRMAELSETAEGLFRSGLVSRTDYDKITARDVDLSKIERLKPPSGREIVALRERANMSQAVFARFLNVGTSTLSQWEREEKRPRGTAARLLAVVKAKGVQALLG